MILIRVLLLSVSLVCVSCSPRQAQAPQAAPSAERIFRAHPEVHQDLDCPPFLEKIQSSLLVLKGKKLASYPKPKACPRFVLLYFSASWCPPCHLFTPELRAWYLKVRPKHPEFEVVLGSLDREWAAMEDYVKQTKMPWPILAWPQIAGSPVEKLLPREVPYLVLVDDEGMVLLAAPGMPPTLLLVEKVLNMESKK